MSILIVFGLNFIISIVLFLISNRVVKLCLAQNIKIAVGFRRTVNKSHRSPPIKITNQPPTTPTTIYFQLLIIIHALAARSHQVLVARRHPWRRH